MRETLFYISCRVGRTQFFHGELTMVLFKFTMKLPFQFEEINQVTSKWLKYGVKKRENTEFSNNSHFFSNNATQSSMFNSKSSHFGKIFLQLITLKSFLLWNIFLMFFFELTHKTFTEFTYPLKLRQNLDNFHWLIIVLSNDNYYGTSLNRVCN